MKNAIRKIWSLTIKSSLSAALIALGASTVLTSTTATASADSCWNHNGSIMRLKANGSNRSFIYERPKSTLSNAGVRSGTLLFNGQKQGNTYSGTARRFSRFCPGTPLEYSVQGPVRSDQLQVTVFGNYEVYDRCQPTGQFREDRLVFTYAYDC
jgi:hypothetical protein